MKRIAMLLFVTVLVVALCAPATAFAYSKSLASPVVFSKTNITVLTGYHTVYYNVNDKSPNYWQVYRQWSKGVAGNVSYVKLNKVAVYLYSNGSTIHSTSVSPAYKMLAGGYYAYTWDYLANALKSGSQSRSTWTFDYVCVTGSGTGQTLTGYTPQF